MMGSELGDAFLCVRLLVVAGGVRGGSRVAVFLTQLFDWERAFTLCL